MTTEERFWAKVDRSGDCWLWMGSARGHDGYGQFQLRRVAGKQINMLAHRYAYEATHGFALPVGHALQVHHACENKRCVNPAHLIALEPRDHRAKHPASPLGAGFCEKGHPFDDENTYVYRGTRYCRECRRINWRKHGGEYKRRRRERKSLAMAGAVD